jgi:hypothetical protein
MDVYIMIGISIYIYIYIAETYSERVEAQANGKVVFEMEIYVRK